MFTSFWCGTRNKKQDREPITLTPTPAYSQLRVVNSEEPIGLSTANGVMESHNKNLEFLTVLTDSISYNVPSVAKQKRGKTVYMQS